MRDLSIERLRGGMAAVLIGAAITVCAPRRAAAQNIVVDWNAIAITAAGAAGQNGSLQERSIAITSVAVSDAVNGITNEVHPLRINTDAPGWCLDDSRGNRRCVSCADAAFAVADAIPGHHAGPVAREVWCEPGRPGVRLWRGGRRRDRRDARSRRRGAGSVSVHTSERRRARCVGADATRLCGGAAARLGIRAAMGAQVGRPIQARRGSRPDEPSLCPRPERGEGNRRAEQRDPDRRADQYREILADVGRGDLERRAPSSRARTRPRRVGGSS